MKKKLRFPVLLLLLLLVLAGCGASGASRGTSAKDESYGGSAPAAAPVPSMYDNVAARESAQVQEMGSFAPAEQRLIRTAEIALDVENIDETLLEVKRLLREAGGFAAESSVSGTIVGSRYAWLTLRVPSTRLDALLESLEAVGKRTSLRTGDQDVTLHYVDLQARIRNAERQEERLLDILDKGETVEDILRVEQELARVRGQLESMTAEFRYLSDRVDYATISVSLRETATASPTISGSGLKGVWQRGVAGLVNSVNGMLIGLGNLLVFILTSLPYLMLLALLSVPAVLVLRRFWHNRPPRTPEA